MKQRMDLRQSQQLALLPVMRTALSVLRMSSLELAEEIEREAASNPFLQRDSPREPVTSQQFSPSGDQTSHEVSFHVSLGHQLAQMGLPPGVEAAAQILVGELREDGLLDVTLEELGVELGLDLALLESALAALQRCEPVGVGARDLAECLRLQLTDRGLSPDQAAETVTHIRMFAARDWTAIARILGLPQAEARRRADLIRTLSTRPVPALEPLQLTLTRADLILQRGANDTLSVALERDRLPAVRLDESLVSEATQSGFAPELLARARNLIAAIEQRGQTLRRIGEWLVENQAGFFAAGPAALEPATRAQLADGLGLHPSTISRAMAGKAIDVDGRLWPLSVFFSAAIRTKDGEISARCVQQRIAEMIAAEPPACPLSDKAVVEQLRTEGVDIARRTVTKYRQGLRIPSSAARRRQAAARHIR